MATSPGLHIACRAAGAETETLLAVPRDSGPYALGYLQAHPRLVLTFDGLPKHRVIHVQHSTVPGAGRRLLVEDVSTNGNRPLSQCPSARKAALRSNRVAAPVTAASPVAAASPTRECSFVAGGTKSQASGFVVSWTVGERPSSPCSRTPSPAQLPPSMECGQLRADASSTDPSDVPCNDEPYSPGGPTDGLHFRGRPRPGMPARRRHSDEPLSTRPRKRLRPSASPGELADSEDEETAAVSLPPTPPPAGFPCPLSLYRPRDQPPCCYQRLRTPRHVVRHLCIRHRRPPFCPVCGARFKTHAACDSHIVSRTCSLSETPPVVAGLAEEQIEDLWQLPDSSRSEAELYRAIWDIVLPGVQPPEASGAWMCET